MANKGVLNVQNLAEKFRISGMSIDKKRMRLLQQRSLSIRCDAPPEAQTSR